MLKEYDVTRRNIHHNPLLKQVAAMEDTNEESVPITTNVNVGPSVDEYGNVRISNGPSTSFDYSETTPADETEEDFDSWFDVDVDMDVGNVESAEIATFEQLMMDENRDRGLKRMKKVKEMSDTTMEKELIINLNGREYKFLLANFHQDWQILDLIKKSLKNLQGVRFVPDQNTIIENLEEEYIDKSLNMGLSFEETAEILKIVKEAGHPYDNMPIPYKLLLLNRFLSEINNIAGVTKDGGEIDYPAKALGVLEKWGVKLLNPDF